MVDLPILPRDLPPTDTVEQGDVFILDQGVGGLLYKVTAAPVVNSVAPVATQTKAVVGTDDNDRMTPLKTKQSIASEVGVSIASYAAGQAGLSAVQPTLTITAGTGLTGGGTLAANREIALNSASIASLALANSAVQPDRSISAGTGLAGGGDLSADRSLSLSTATQTSLGKADSAIQAPGGSTGQVLTKNSGTDGDVAWQTVAAATAVSYAPQTLTAPQQGQARVNISAFEQPSGTTGQYLRGDGSTATMNKAAVGLGNVDNTSDAAKPISTATQTALNLKFNNTGGTVSGTIISTGGIRANTTATVGGTGQGKVLFYNDTNVYIGEMGVSVNSGFGNSIGFYNNSSGNWSFNNSLSVSGSISKGSGTFRIDHPLDPLNKNLRHGFVEAPEYLNIYRGEVRLVNGRAIVNIDEHFGMMTGTFWALNTDISVCSLQNQEGFARVRPKTKMTSGQLEIICEDEACNDLIAWAVTGRRRDAFVLYMDGNCESATGRFIPEFNKPDYSEVENG